MVLQSGTRWSQDQDARGHCCRLENSDREHERRSEANLSFNTDLYSLFLLGISCMLFALWCQICPPCCRPPVSQVRSYGYDSGDGLLNRSRFFLLRPQSDNQLGLGNLALRHAPLKAETSALCQTPITETSTRSPLSIRGIQPGVG